MKNNYTNGSLFTGKPLTVSETAISGMVADYLDARRIYNDRLNSGMVRVGHRFIYLCKSGTPDRLAIISGRAVYIEVKSAGKKPTADQINRHTELRAAGAFVIVCDSFDEFVRQFKELFDELKSEFLGKIK